MREKLRKIWVTDPEDINKEKIKSLFRQYLLIIGASEILTFILFWIFQVEEASPEMTVNENIPFHWKAYCLIAFLIPVLVTFILGFASELEKRREQVEYDKAVRIQKIIWPYGFPDKRKIAVWLVAVAGFIILVLMLGFSDIGSYRKATLEILTYLMAFFVLLAFSAGLATLIMKYKTKANILKTEYAKAISRQLGVSGHETSRM